MKTLYKKLFIALLSGSNFAVLTVIFYTYFDSHQGLQLFSQSETSQSLQDKIKEECSDELDELMQDKRSSFICEIKVPQRAKRASYKLKTQIQVRKNAEGEFVIEGQGKIQDPTKHAIEADFCDDCLYQRTAEKDSSGTEVMKEILDLAKGFYATARDSVESAEEKYGAKDREKKLARAKVLRCIGQWNDDSESFEEFDREQRIKCKMKKISRKNTMEIDDFYHNNLKLELWRTALSEEDDILDDILDDFTDAWRYSFSVRSSANLIRGYLNWKDHFEIMDSIEEKNRFIQGVQRDVEQTIGFMNRDLLARDLRFLNEGFDGMLGQIQQAGRQHTVPQSAPAASPVNYQRLQQETQHLYNQ